MIYPTDTASALAVLILGLFGSGSWPAVRQVISHVDYEIFNIGFVISMVSSGILMFWLLSFPTHEGDPSGLISALEHFTNSHYRRALCLATLAGSCVSVSNFMLNAAIPMSGLTRCLPVFNGLALITGVLINYWIEGNTSPGTLFTGMGLIITAVILTFISRQKSADGMPLRILSYPDLQRASSSSLPYSTDLVQPDPKTKSAHMHEKSKLNGQEHSYQMINMSSYESTNHDDGQTTLNDLSDKPLEVSKLLACLPGGEVMHGLAMAATAGVIDGCWSSLTLLSKLEGVENYVVGFCFCIGMLPPWIILEGLLWLLNRQSFERRLDRLTKREFVTSLACGFLNIFGIMTYFCATKVVASAVAFAIFLSTPFVSISLGIICMKEITGESPTKKRLVMLILVFYILATGMLSANAFLTTDA